MVKVLQERSFRYSVLLAIVMGLITFIGMLVFDNAAAVRASQQGTWVGFVLPAEAYPGEFIPVKLVVNNAQNLAGFQSTIVFDTIQLRLTNATLEAGLKGTGRDILQLGPVERANSVVIGAATCPAANCGDSYGKQAQPLKGVDGQIELATIQLSANAPGLYELKLENIKLVDPQGNSLAASSANAVLQVRSK